VRACGACTFLEPPQGGSGLCPAIASDTHLDQLDKGLGEETHVVMLARPLGGGEGDLIATETVV